VVREALAEQTARRTPGQRETPAVLEAMERMRALRRSSKQVPA
jgi:hypothetical protein